MHRQVSVRSDERDPGWTNDEVGSCAGELSAESNESEGRYEALTVDLAGRASEARVRFGLQDRVADGSLRERAVRDKSGQHELPRRLKARDGLEDGRVVLEVVDVEPARLRDQIVDAQKVCSSHSYICWGSSRSYLPSCLSIA